LANNSNPIENQLKHHQEMITDRERPFFESHKIKRDLLIDRITFHERRFKYWPDQLRKNGQEEERARKAKQVEEEKKEKIYRQYLVNRVQSSSLRDFFTFRY